MKCIWLKKAEMASEFSVNNRLKQIGQLGHKSQYAVSHYALMLKR